MTMDEYVTKFTSLLHYVPYLREEKAKVQRFLSSFHVLMREIIDFVNPQTMDEAVRKAHMCYQQYRTKENGGNGWKLGMNGLLVKRLVGGPCDCMKFQGPSGKEVAVL